MNIHVNHTDTELWSHWEMLGPCLALLAVSILGMALGWGLEYFLKEW